MSDDDFILGLSPNQSQRLELAIGPDGSQCWMVDGRPVVKASPVVFEVSKHGRQTEIKGTQVITTIRDAAVSGL